MVLLIASAIFYLWAGVKIIVFLLFSTVTTFVAGLLLGKLAEQQQERREGLPRAEKKLINEEYKVRKQRVVAAALLLNFGLLFLLKYYGLMAESLQAALSVITDAFTIPQMGILLPLGISFYIFQSAGYVIDVYRGKYEPDKNIFKFALFLWFFPQIVQGPIGRYNKLAQQLYGSRDFDADKLKYGLQLMIWGYFKKMIIADRAAVAVNQIFGNYTTYGGALIFFGVFMYSIQIYCDFSGGIDIARGVAEGLGIELAENFRRPYFATSLSDFWRRWHITLGSWMKDYLFYPLALSKPFTELGRKARQRFPGRLGKILPTSLATFIVFFVIGIWHGGNWKYVFFGLYNGTIITFSLICEPVYQKICDRLGIDREGKPWFAFRLLRTLFIVTLGRYFTRADDLMTALHMIKRTVTAFTAGTLPQGFASLGLTVTDWSILVVAVIIMVLAGLVEERGLNLRIELEKRRPVIQVATIMAAVVILTIFGLFREGYIASEFIYKQY
ncbi:MAG: MBOAT family O-acyltransferase [Deltaproteobacteria bacterium]